MALGRNKRGQFVKGARRGRRRGRRARARTISYKAAPRRRTRRRAYRRTRCNPPAMAGRIMGLIPPVKRIAFGAVGAASTRLLPGLAAQYIGPQVPTFGPAGLAIKALAAVLAGFAGKKLLGNQAGEDICFGGLITVLDEGARSYVYPQIPGLPMAAYLDPSVSAYLDPSVGMIGPGAILDDQFDGLGAGIDDDGIESGSTRLESEARF